MKPLCFLLMMFTASFTPAQQVTVGDLVPPFSLNLIDAPEAQLSAEELRGQVVLLDFWATWCSPCIAGMPHLDSLQAAFEDELQIVAVSNEDLARLQRFQQNTDHRFRYARDTGALHALFPHGIIPHSVLIDPRGQVVAITEPKHITATVVQRVLDGQPIDLPLKQERFEFDPSKDIFNPDSNARASFQLQPHQPGWPTMTRTYPKGPFRNRRISIYNLTIPGLYRNAYQVSTYRVELTFDEALVAWEDEANRYCLDIIAPRPEDLYPDFQRQLEANVSIKPRWETQTKEVLIIEASDPSKLAALAVDSAALGYSGRGDGFSSEGATLDEFCAYLEGFGLAGRPVLNETGLDGVYRIDFSFDPENPASFRAAMEELGLSYAKQEQEIEVLVLYQEE